MTARVRRVVTRRLPKAYPIYRTGTHERLAKVDGWLSQLEGLLSFGIQGLFAHDDTHHVLHMAYSAVDCVGPDGDFDWERWGEFRRLFQKRLTEFLRTMNGISV